MDKPDPYGDWVLFSTQEENNQSPVEPDEELLSAARAAWPRALAHAKREFSRERLGSDGATFAVQVWERLLRSVSKTRQRDLEHRPRISDLETYLIGAFRHRFTRVLLRERKRAETIELVSSTVDLERIETAKRTEWVEELERAIAVRQIIDQMDSWTKKVWQAREYGYSWKEISGWLGFTEDQTRKKFEYGIEKTRHKIARMLKLKRPR
jgi:hypothetical protein